MSGANAIDMTIKQASDHLGVSERTIGRLLSSAGFTGRTTAVERQTSKGCRRTTVLPPDLLADLARVIAERKGEDLPSIEGRLPLGDEVLTVPDSPADTPADVPAIPRRFDGDTAAEQAQNVGDTPAGADVADESERITAEYLRTLPAGAVALLAEKDRTIERLDAALKRSLENERALMVLVAQRGPQMIPGSDSSEWSNGLRSGDSGADMAPGGVIHPPSASAGNSEGPRKWWQFWRKGKA